MPGFLYHLYFAQQVFQRLNNNKMDKISFLEGNLIPDVTQDKTKSHYKIPSSVAYLMVPDMNLVKKELFDKDSAIKFGMYSHLYLDYQVIENYLIKQYIWKGENVTNPCNNKTWNVHVFYSNKGIYKDYSNINLLLLRDNHVSLHLINSIPKNLSTTGIPIFDTRKDMMWKEELNKYLQESGEHTNEFINYEKFCNAIEMMAEKLAWEYNNA